MLSGLVNTEYGLIKRCGRKKDKQRAYLTGVAISWLLGVVGKSQVTWNDESKTKN